MQYSPTDPPADPKETTTGTDPAALSDALIEARSRSLPNREDMFHAITKTDVRPSIGLALLPIVLTLGILGVQIFIWGFHPAYPAGHWYRTDGRRGPIEGLSGMRSKKAHPCDRGLFPAVSVLILVGMIVGTWIASGAAPTLIYYGLSLLSPQLFLAAGMILRSIVSLALGTSWGTVGTVVYAHGHWRRHSRLLDRRRGGFRPSLAIKSRPCRTPPTLRPP